MNRVADICILAAVAAAVLLGLFTETDWHPKKYFRTWIGILIGTLVVCLISVSLVITFGDPEQVWILAWLLYD